MALADETVKFIALNYIDLKEAGRVSDFKEFCENRGGFLRIDYFRIKKEIKNLLTNGQRSFSQGMIPEGAPSRAPSLLSLLGWEQHGKSTERKRLHGNSQ